MEELVTILLAAFTSATISILVNILWPKQNPLTVTKPKKVVPIQKGRVISHYYKKKEENQA